MAWYNVTVDPRWHGRAATYLAAFTAKNFILIAFSILVVIERRLYGTSSDDPNYHPYVVPLPHALFFRTAS
jgi:hypothetical protein